MFLMKLWSEFQNLIKPLHREQAAQGVGCTEGTLLRGHVVQGVGCWMFGFDHDCFTRLQNVESEQSIDAITNS